jgi:proteasome lid subunit RPN8/RPN11
VIRKIRMKRKALHKINTLIVKESILSQAEGHILRNGQREYCGFLLGTLNKHNAWVDRVIFATNISESSDHFCIHPLDYARVLDSLADKEQLIGIFHSHRKSPRPSPKDIETMHLHPFLWLILGNTERGKDGKIRKSAYKVSDGNTMKVLIKILNDRR